MIELANFICGEYKISSLSKPVYNFNDEEYANIYSATDADLRKIKRSFSNIQMSLKNISLSEIITVIQKAADYYLNSNDDIKHLINLTGSPISFLNKSITTRREWCKNIDKFIDSCFGLCDYSSIPINIDQYHTGYRAYSSPSPVVVFLPSNSDEESCYVIVQALLSKSPCLIRTSSKKCSSFSSLKFIEALKNAIDEIGNIKLNILLQAINIINLFDLPHKMNIVEKLAVRGANYVIFGSNETINQVSIQLKDFMPRKVIKMGTGCCASFLLNDCNINSAVQELCESVYINNGNECICTSIAYIEKDIYSEALAKLKKLSEKIQFSNPFDNLSYMGHPSSSYKNEISAYFKKMLHIYNSTKIDYSKMILIELDEENIFFDELPGPVLFIRKIESVPQGITELKNVLDKKNIQFNLSTSIFTENINKFYTVTLNMPSYNCKFNKGTHNMNMFLEHQGKFLLKELMELKLLEI